MIGCEFCVDLGSADCRNSGLTDQELLALPRYRQSELFTERERAGARLHGWRGCERPWMSLTSCSLA